VLAAGILIHVDRHQADSDQDDGQSRYDRGAPPAARPLMLGRAPLIRCARTWPGPLPWPFPLPWPLPLSWPFSPGRPFPLALALPLGRSVQLILMVCRPAPAGTAHDRGVRRGPARCERGRSLRPVMLARLLAGGQQRRRRGGVDGQPGPFGQRAGGWLRAAEQFDDHRAGERSLRRLG
jgi:hypothetical protein